MLSCSKNSESSSVPECLDDFVVEFQDTWQDCENASIHRIMFNDKELIAFNDGICITDGASLIYQECELLCTLGTIAGLSECDGINFFQADVEILETIWEAN
jgi:hypothetical protein